MCKYTGFHFQCEIFVWCHFIHTHVHAQKKRFSYRGEKRTSESSPHVETRMGNPKTGSLLLPLVNTELWWLLRKWQDTTVLSPAVSLLPPDMYCLLVSYWVSGVQSWSIVPVRMDELHLGSSKSPFLKIQCSLKNFFKFIVTFIKFSWVSVISASNLFSLWWNKICS